MGISLLHQKYEVPMFKRLIGDRAFYRRALMIAIPIIIQNGITNFVSLLDNVMVGQVGTIPMSGVAIVNNLIFVFNMCVFGATSGAGIFTAQFHGSQDHDGVRSTFRYKILISILLSVAGCGLFFLAGDSLAILYLKGEADAAIVAETLAHGLSYLRIMILGLPAFAFSYAYSSTLRETGQGTVPMIASIVAVLLNLALNYALIFGHLGAPALGIRGAAIATVIARYVELAIVAFWTHANPAINPFIRNAYQSLHIPKKLFTIITVKGMPLLVNEFLWSSGIAFLSQCYSIRGLDVVAAFTITTTLSNLSNIAFMAMGNAVGIIMGQMLGSQVPESELRDANRKLMALSVASCAVFGGAMAAVSGIFPKLYNTTDSVQSIATALICINAMIMPFNAYTTASYFTLRSGGKTAITFIFDSGFVWCIIAPTAYCLSHFTALPIIPLYAICQATDLPKCIMGYLMIKKGDWIQNLVSE